MFARWGTENNLHVSVAVNFIDGSVEISWQPSTEIMGAEIDVHENNTRRAICNAETAHYGGRPHDAVRHQ